MSELSAIHRLHAITLDELWKEAETLGVVEVDRRAYPEDSPYVVEIGFKRRSGTRVVAVGHDTSIHFAMASAINEAREMGAGVDQ